MPRSSLLGKMSLGRTIETGSSQTLGSEKVWQTFVKRWGASCLAAVVELNPWPGEQK
jgi:hypothetical protein